MKSFLPYLISLTMSHETLAFQGSSSYNRGTTTTLPSPPTWNPRNTALLVATDKDITMNDESIPVEYALILPGQSLRIQIGDVTAARKAWKKRRRNSSPILIPCSILGMNREWMLRGTLMTMLHMLAEEIPSAAGVLGVTCAKLGRAYRQRLGGDLKDHAKLLGYPTVESLLQSLFDDRIQAEYGIQTLIEPQHGNLILTTALTRYQARSFSRNAGMLQFRCQSHNNREEDADNPYEMIHTGMAKALLSSSIGSKPTFSEEPLGAAIRVSPGEDAAERYKPGDEFNAFVYSYDQAGDNNSPLLVLTVDDPRGRNSVRTLGANTRVFQRRTISTNRLVNDTIIERELSDLSVGDGPFVATVVAVSFHSNAAFVDCGVGRVKGKRYGGAAAKVLGMLRFEDMLNVNSDETFLKAGEEVEVYIKAVFPQSGRFMVSLDPSVKDKKPKEMKKEREAEKRKERLMSRLEKDSIESLIGCEFDGVVKARSKTGSWYYVQPHMDENQSIRLPIGVANFDKNEIAEEDTGNGLFSDGDIVRVRLEGIDHMRGQLSLTLLEIAAQKEPLI